MSRAQSGVKPVIYDKRLHSLKCELEGRGWKLLGYGGFNMAFVYRGTDLALIAGSDYKGPWVYKQRIIVDDSKDVTTLYLDTSYDPESTDTAERSIRLWNSINRDLPRAGYFRNGWVCPYLGSDKATDKETAQGVLETYRTDRRIVADACGRGNYLKHNGKARCVDIALALKRRNSRVSDLYWSGDGEELVDGSIDEGSQGSYAEYWQQFATLKTSPMPLTVDAIKGLLVLEDAIGAQSIKDEHLELDIMLLLNRARRLGYGFTLNLVDSLSCLYRQGLLDLGLDWRWLVGNPATQALVLNCYDAGLSMTKNLLQSLESDPIFCRVLSGLLSASVRPGSVKVSDKLVLELKVFAHLKKSLSKLFACGLPVNQTIYSLLYQCAYKLVDIPTKGEKSMLLELSQLSDNTAHYQQPKVPLLTRIKGLSPEVSGLLHCHRIHMLQLRLRECAGYGAAKALLCQQWRNCCAVIPNRVRVSVCNAGREFESRLWRPRGGLNDSYLTLLKDLTLHLNHQQQQGKPYLYESKPKYRASRALTSS